ncbi:ArsR/SmtB family transcription factor [Streptomyces yaizuensis]|uniref:HTH arsR-type domain-containing protein n=1 Tax=Streptomyces yaizuensis TaxID=2989713 RepID=A0ABQ5NY57_9ACTN|nr:helix-turn-helix domain-containing protein [Streptomyces sp. YSPA8]GLF95293.1 hypothetical protein SYYSPA8_13370 [Streptomyces sp. YSPA8]
MITIADRTSVHRLSYGCSPRSGTRCGISTTPSSCTGRYGSPWVAEEGIGAVLAGLLPGARLDGGVWELPGPPREVRPGGCGLLLVPAFDRAGGPLLADLPGRPVAVTYPAGPGLPLQPDGSTGTLRLARVIGPTRTELPHLLDGPRTTTALARHLRVSAATVSAHTTALGGAGLITAVRTGRAVLHRRTVLGGLLLAPDAPTRVHGTSVQRFTHK